MTVVPVGHARHWPQDATASSRASQPLAAIPSQSAKSAAHVTIAHVPDAHEVVAALGSAHATPQPPQFALVLSRVSQPAAVVQSPYPV